MQRPLRHLYVYSLQGTVAWTTAGGTRGEGSAPALGKLHHPGALHLFCPSPGRCHPLQKKCLAARKCIRREFPSSPLLQLPSSLPSPQSSLPSHFCASGMHFPLLHLKLSAAQPGERAAPEGRRGTKPTHLRHPAASISLPLRQVKPRQLQHTNTYVLLPGLFLSNLHATTDLCIPLFPCLVLFFSSAAGWHFGFPARSFSSTALALLCRPRRELLTALQLVAVVAAVVHVVADPELGLAPAVLALELLVGTGYKKGEREIQGERPAKAPAEPSPATPLPAHPPRRHGKSGAAPPAGGRAHRKQHDRPGLRTHTEIYKHITHLG